MNITADIFINIPLAQKMKSALPPATLELANEMMKDTSPYVPFLNGKLDQSAHVMQRGTGAAIIYGGAGVRYARYLYHGMLMVDPNTGSSWAKSKVTKVLTAKPLRFNKSAHPKATSKWFAASKLHNFEKWKDYAGKALMKYAK